MSKSKKFKPPTIICSGVAIFLGLVAATIGFFWWPVGVALLFIALLVAGFSVLGGDAAEEINGS